MESHPNVLAVQAALENADARTSDGGAPRMVVFDEGVHTGQAIGGVAPLGHPKPVRTLVDTALAGYPEIWAAGGVPQAVFPITYAELLRVTGGTATDVA